MLKLAFVFFVLPRRRLSWALKAVEYKANVAGILFFAAASVLVVLATRAVYAANLAQ